MGRRFSLVERVGLDRGSYSTLGPVSAWMGDRLRAGKLSRYVTSHSGQLSLAIPLWVGVMSTSLGWEGNCSLASHWPCVTDSSGLSTYRLNGL